MREIGLILGIYGDDGAPMVSRAAKVTFGTEQERDQFAAEALDKLMKWALTRLHTLEDSNAGQHN